MDTILNGAGVFVKTYVSDHNMEAMLYALVGVLLLVILVLATSPSRRRYQNGNTSIPHVSAVATAFPKHCVSQDQVVKVFHHHCNLYGHSQEFVDWQCRVVDKGGVDRRHTVFPSWNDSHFGTTKDDPDDIYNRYNWNPPAHERAAAYRKHSTELARQACEKVLHEWKYGSARDITHVVAVTTSGWDEPGLACKVIDLLGLSPDTEKYELVFNGCFAGVTGLRLARDLFLANAGKKCNIFVLAVEVTTVHYNSTSDDRGKVLGNLLFGDGAGAMIVSDQGNWELEELGVHKVPGSSGTLTMHPSTNSNHGGFEMTLGKNLASDIKSAFMGPFGKSLVAKIYNKCGLMGRKPAFALHPGGSKILKSVASAFENLRLGEVAPENFEVMRTKGNMATVSIIAVLDELLKTCDRDYIVMLSFGPGVTIEHGFLKRRTRS